MSRLHGRKERCVCWPQEETREENDMTQDFDCKKWKKTAKVMEAIQSIGKEVFAVATIVGLVYIVIKTIKFGY